MHTNTHSHPHPYHCPCHTSFSPRLASPAPPLLLPSHVTSRQAAILDTIMQKSTLTFNNVAGLTEAKQVLREAIVLPLQYPHLFTGARQPWRGYSSTDHQGQVGMHSCGLLGVASDEVEMCALNPGVPQCALNPGVPRCALNPGVPRCALNPGVH